uniref:Fungal lipase-type domain-containing protein n=1 Tax=Phytophthora ramorum TaxID=164328 RepID=H3HAY6_PHYRM
MNGHFDASPPHSRNVLLRDAAVGYSDRLMNAYKQKDRVLATAEGREEELHAYSQARGKWRFYRTLCQVRFGYLSFLVVMMVLMFSFTLLMEIFFAIFLPSAKYDEYYTVRAVISLVLLPVVLFFLSYIFEEASRLFLDALNKSDGSMPNFRLALAVVIHYLRHRTELVEPEESDDPAADENETLGAGDELRNSRTSAVRGGKLHARGSLLLTAKDDPFLDDDKEEEDEAWQRKEAAVQKEQADAEATEARAGRLSAVGEGPPKKNALNRWKRVKAAVKTTLLIKKVQEEGPPIDLSTFVIVDIVCPAVFEVVTAASMVIKFVATWSMSDAFLAYVQMGFWRLMHRAVRDLERKKRAEHLWRFPQIFGRAFRKFISAFVLVSLIFFSSSFIIGTFVSGGAFKLGKFDNSTALISSELKTTHGISASITINGKVINFDDTSEYAACSVSYQGLSVLDLALMADASYGTTTDIQKSALENRFNGTELENWKYVARNNESTDGQTWMEIYFPSANMTVIAVRGTASATDALEDMHFWFGICIMQAANVFVPFLKQLPRTFVVRMLSMNLISHVMPSPVYTDLLNHAVDTRARVGNNLVITGHSLGGAIAAMIGAKTKTSAVSFSGPGLLYSLGRFDISAQDVRDYVLTMKPRKDIVPQVDELGGLVQEIRCKKSSPMGCHSTSTHLCELYFSCGDPRQRNWSTNEQCIAYNALASDDDDDE